MKKVLVPLLLLSAAFVTPTYANYFSNPQTGVTLNFGSAPNPTPDDIRGNRAQVVAEAPDDRVDEKNMPDTRKVAASDDKHNPAPPSGGTAGMRPTSPSP